MNKTDLTTMLKPENVIEILVTLVDLLLSLLPFFTIKRNPDADGLYCTLCECTLKYNFSNGLSFGLIENILASFSHLIYNKRSRRRTRTEVLIRMLLSYSGSKISQDTYFHFGCKSSILLLKMPPIRHPFLFYYF